MLLFVYIIDITGKTIMPGLIDTHLHFSGNLNDNDSDWVREPLLMYRFRVDDEEAINQAIAKRAARHLISRTHSRKGDTI